MAITGKIQDVKRLTVELQEVLEDKSKLVMVSNRLSNEALDTLIYLFTTELHERDKFRDLL